MKLLPRILSRIAFVRIEFISMDECRTEVYLWRRHGLASGDWDAVKGCLTAVIVCGHGVVTKPDSAEIITRIMADPETFLWSSADGRTSFIRRDRLQSLPKEFAAHDIVPYRVFCADSSTDFGQTAEELAQRLYSDLHWRSLIRLTPESSSVTQVLVRRAGLPVLGLFLCLLAGNAVLSPQLNARRQTLQTHLAARERSVSTSAATGARQRELLAEFGARPASPRSVVCDRIARAVPERVLLTALEIEPLIKRFEAGKPLQCRENIAFISGAVPVAADISVFVQRLSELKCCRDVRLTNVEKERDGDRLIFRIEITL